MQGWGRHMFSVVIGSSLLTGCFANQSTVFRTDTIDPPELVITDGGQRAISSTVGPDNRTIVCKERYPDVFWGLATSSALSIKIAEKGEAQAAVATGQEAGFAGLRTQLRESQARTLDALCDFYAGGAIDGDELEILLRRFQNHVLAALAIEQLTGYARPTVVTLSSAGEGGVGAGLVQAQEALDKAQALLKEKQDALTPLQQAQAADETNLKTLHDDNNSKAAAAKQAMEKQTSVVAAANDKLKTAQQGNNQDAINAAKATLDAETKALDKLKSDEKTRADAADKAIKAQQGKVDEAKKIAEGPAKEVADQEAIVKTLTANRDAASRAVSASTTSKEAGISQPPQIVLSEKGAEHVARAITHIIDGAFSQHYTAEQCQRYLFSKNFNSNSSRDPRTVLCLAYFETVRKSVEVLTKAKADAIGNYYKANGDGPGQPVWTIGPGGIMIPYAEGPGQSQFGPPIIFDSEKHF